MVPHLSSALVQQGPFTPFQGWRTEYPAEHGYVWLTPHGPAIVTQSTEPVVRVELVDALHDFLDLLLQAGVRTRMPVLTLLHDWRSVQQVDADAAKRFLQRMARPGRPFAAYQTYVASSANPLARMAMRTAALGHQALSGQRAVRFVDDPDPVLKQLRIAAPPDGFLARWLAEGQVHRP